MECQLADMERFCHRHFCVVSRWKATDKEYADAKRLFLMEKQSQLLTCLWATVVKTTLLAMYEGKNMQVCSIYCT